jgi:hypothetical protein
MKGRTKGSDPYAGENHGHAKLTKENVLQIIHLLDDRRHSHAEIGEMFGVAPSTISAIHVGHRWNYLTNRRGHGTHAGVF